VAGVYRVCAEAMFFDTKSSAQPVPNMPMIKALDGYYSWRREEARGKGTLSSAASATIHLLHSPTMSRSQIAFSYADRPTARVMTHSVQVLATLARDRIQSMSVASAPDFC